MELQSSQKRHRHETIDHYITVAVVLCRIEERGVEARDSKNLTLSWGAGLTEAISKLKFDREMGLI